MENKEKNPEFLDEEPLGLSLVTALLSLLSIASFVVGVCFLTSKVLEECNLFIGFAGLFVFWIISAILESLSEGLQVKAGLLNPKDRVV